MRARFAILMLLLPLAVFAPAASVNAFRAAPQPAPAVRLMPAGEAIGPIVGPTAATPQLGARPAEEWIKTLDGPTRVAALKIDEVVAAMKLRPGQIVADIGAGPGLFEVPLAKAVGPKGRVYAEDIDAGFFPAIRKRADDAQLVNVETVLGGYTDPGLPIRNVDVALFHDVIHHVEKRADYIRTLVGYLAPSGRIVVVDYEPGKGPHRDQPDLEVSRDQLAAWTSAAGFRQVDDVKLFEDKYFLVFAKR